MRKRFLAAATALAVAAGLTTSAMAFDRNAGGDSHSRHFHAGASGAMHGARHSHISRFAEVRGSEGLRHDGWNGGSASYYHGGFIDLGPLGITAACGSYRHGPGYCGPGYSVNAWSR